MATVIGESKDAQKTATCYSGCGAVIQYLPVEVQVYHGRDYSGGPDGCRWVNCPRCGKRVVIESW